LGYCLLLQNAFAETKLPKCSAVDKRRITGFVKQVFLPGRRCWPGMNTGRPGFAVLYRILDAN
jgi:hypothetical protein